MFAGIAARKAHEKGLVPASLSPKTESLLRARTENNRHASERRSGRLFLLI